MPEKGCISLFDAGTPVYLGWVLLTRRFSGVYLWVTSQLFCRQMSALELRAFEWCLVPETGYLHCDRR